MNNIINTYDKNNLERERAIVKLLGGMTIAGATYLLDSVKSLLLDIKIDEEIEVQLKESTLSMSAAEAIAGLAAKD
jgi:hypothetical protein